MIGVVDYGAGNLRSVETALEYLGLDYQTSQEPGNLGGADRLIFPGVGEAAAAMKNLRQAGWDSFLGDYADTGRPLLGICLGCQIVLDYSEERQTPCLGLVPGRARRFSGGEGLKVPHMGWNTLSLQPASPEGESSREESSGQGALGERTPIGGSPGPVHPLFAGIPQDSSFYFVHSYYPDPDPSGARVLGVTEYGEAFPAAFAQGNLAAVQFHPEKSGPVGLRLLANFAGWDGSGEGG